ncbi:FtsX-like permease family protein [Roseivirga seohaensis]|uniref:ABC transporter permease n=1 Tax=Roseivirga seohaensis TaxID=1914963 RepID=UPI003BAC48A3
MIKQTFKFAIKSFRKSTFLHFLNIAGLTLGLSVYFLVTLYLYQENSYERGFSQKDDIFQVSYTMIGNKFAQGPPNLAQVIFEIPEVEQFTSFKKRTITLRLDDLEYRGASYLVDSSFLKVFDYELVMGDRSTALSAPNSAVLSEEYARELFGTEDVYGKTIFVTSSSARDSLSQVPIVISGVIKTPVFKSQLNFDLLVSEVRIPDSSLPLDGWQNSSIYNYLVAVPNTTTSKLDERLFELSHKYIQPKTYGGQVISAEEWKNAGLYCGFYTETLDGLRIGSETTNNLMPSLDASQLKTMAIVALAALIISILNFVSLSTSRASARMKEVGVKRILGSSKRQLIFQFMLESFIVVMFSSILALAIVEGLITLNTNLVGIKVDYSVLQTTEWITALVLFVFFLTLVSGIYPALYLSSANLSAVLKNGSAKKSFSILNAGALRKGAAVLQFTCSAGLIIAVITMYLQVEHIQNRNIGYDPFSVLVLNTYELKESKNTFKDALAKYPAIESAAHISRLPFKESHERPRNLKLSDSTEMSYTYFTVDDSFFKTMEMEFIQGYGFEEFEGNTIVNSTEEGDSQTQVKYPMVVNEVAAKIMGLTSNNSKQLADSRFQVIGVVNDFYFSDLRQSIEPVVISRKTYSGLASYHYPLLVKVNDPKEARANIEELWSQFSDKELNIQLMESSYTSLLKIEEEGLRAVLVFSVLSVIVSCLGLFGLAVFTLDQRVHEFGIRKVLGASVADIMKLFGASFMKLLVVAFILAIPTSIYLLKEWLSTYADRIDLSFSIFALSSVLIFLIVVVTLLFQSLKAGRLNPVDTLRNE